MSIPTRVPFSSYKGLNKERKVINRKQKEKNREKFFYVNGHDFSTENNPVPQDTKIKLFVKIALEHYKNFQNFSANCIFKRNSITFF